MDGAADMTTSTVAAPSVVFDMPDDEYRAHPALSASGAKKLLAPSCPAIYRWEKTHPPAPRQVFDFGHAAHQLTLGMGQPIRVLDYPDYKTKAAQDAKKAAYADGDVPLLTAEMEQVQAMAEAFKTHPVVGALFNPEKGHPEASLFWHDDQHDVDRKARLDWLPDVGAGRMVVPDYKTAISAAPTRFARQAADLNYHMQAAWYLDAVTACLDVEWPGFVFVVQEKTAPYLVSVVELDGEALRIGALKNADALKVFAECTATDEWPSYTHNDIELVGLPAWADRQYA